MMIENEALKEILAPLFPKGCRWYINDTPKNFTRPCFVFIDPEDQVDVRELSRSVCRQTKTISFFHFYPDKDHNAGETAKREVLAKLNGEPKHLLPGLDRRYMEVVATAAVDKVNCLIRFTIRATRTLPRDHVRPTASKIKQIVHKVELGGK